MTGPDVRSLGPDDPDDDRPAGSTAFGQDPEGSAPVAQDPGARDPGPWLPRADPAMGIAQCPPFRPDTVSLGPFNHEPFDLQDITYRTPNGNMRQPADNSRCLAEWLTGALDAAGVSLGAFDRLQVHLIATDGWGPVQAVAGWITRARHADPSPAPTPGPPPDPGPAPPNPGPPASSEPGPDPPGPPDSGS